MWILYQLALALLLLLAAPFLLLRRGPRELPELLRARLGRGPTATAPGERPLWIHAVSVGEVGVAATLAPHLPEDTPLLVTTVTPTGQERARRQFGDRAGVTYLPFDLGIAVAPFLDRHRPRGLILIEGELWPYLLHEVGARNLPIVLVNGRISDRTFARMTRLRRWIPRSLERVLYRPIDRLCVQSEQDRDRLVLLGAREDRVVVTGNLKYETPAPAPIPELERQVDTLAAGRPVLVAGSTMRHEEEQVLDAFARLPETHPALLVLAPRHPERFGAVEELIRGRGIALARRSTLGGDGTPGRVAVLLLDTLGELAALYAHALGAFIGGTLVPTGGHNPLEAARFGTAVVVGPSMQNFHEIATPFDQATAWARADDAAALSRVWSDWLAAPEHARELGRRGLNLVERNQGALDATLGAIGPLLGETTANAREPR